MAFIPMRTFLCLAGLASGFGVVASGSPAFHISNVFGSNMVLQRGKPIPVWGWGCTPSELVMGSFSPYGNQSATCDSTGYWKLVWPSQTVNASPLTLTVCSPSGGCVALANVLIGDVYLIGGQSNAEFNVFSSFNNTAEIAAADNYPLIRVTSGPLQGQYDLHTIPIDYLSPELVAVDLPWSVANSTVIQGNGKGWDYYSAVGWFYLRDTFDRNMAAGEVVPLGGAVQCYGGTSIQWWSSKEALDSCPLSQTNPGSACCSYGGNASCLYNTQIHPYTYGPTQFSAVFYYQGEQVSVTGDAVLQRSFFQALCLTSSHTPILFPPFPTERRLWWPPSNPLLSLRAARIDCGLAKQVQLPHPALWGVSPGSLAGHQ